MDLSKIKNNLVKSVANGEVRILPLTSYKYSRPDSSRLKIRKRRQSKFQPRRVSLRLICKVISIVVLARS